MQKNIHSTSERNVPPPNHHGDKAHHARWVLCLYESLVLLLGLGLSLAFGECKEEYCRITFCSIFLVLTIYLSFLILRKWNDYIIVSNLGIEIHIHPGWFIYHHRVDFFIRWIDVKWWRIYRRKYYSRDSSKPHSVDNRLIIQTKYQEEPFSFPIEDFHEVNRAIPRTAITDRRQSFSAMFWLYIFTSLARPLSSMISIVANHKQQKSKR